MKYINLIKMIYILLALVLLAACNNATITNPDGKELNDKIVFFSDRDMDRKVFIISPDGKEQKIIQFSVPSGTKIKSLTWSNSLQKWAFSGEIDGLADIFVASADGQTIKNITNTESIYEDEPNFSPDGKYIAFVTADIGRNTAVATSRIDGLNFIKVSQFPMIETTPVWMIDSQSLLMISSKEGSPNLFKLRLDGTDLTNISKGKGLDSDYSLSENNSIVVFLSDRAGGRKIFGYIFASGTILQLTDESIGICFGPIVSRDGTKVVFRSERGGESDLYLLDVASKSVKKLTNTPKVVELTYVWSFDGKNIVYSAENNGKYDVFIINLEGSAVSNLTNNPSNDFRPIWIRIKP